jgi:hypothetical protein
VADSSRVPQVAFLSKLRKQQVMSRMLSTMNCRRTIQLIGGVQEGLIRPWFFGVAYDPLTYYIEFLTATVFDA